MERCAVERASLIVGAIAMFHALCCDELRSFVDVNRLIKLRVTAFPSSSDLLSGLSFENTAQSPAKLVRGRFAPNRIPRYLHSCVQ